MKLKTIIYFFLSVCFFFAIFSGDGLGAAFVSLCLAALFGWLGWRTLKKPAVKAAVETPQQPKEEPYEYLYIKLAGVTFKNGRKSRQTILRAMKFRDGEFENDVELELKPYEYEGAQAYGIYANGQQIGNVPADMVQYISDNYDRIIDFSHINVYGGGRAKDGTQKNFGCEVTLRLKK